MSKKPRCLSVGLGLRAACIIAVLRIVFGAARAGAEEPFFSGGFKEACVEATRSKRLVLIDFQTTWCPPCRLLESRTWADKEVHAFLKEKCVSLKIDAEKDVDLAKRFRISAYPTVVFLKADGTEIDRFVGFKDPSAFFVIAKEALTGKDALSRAREKLAADKDNPKLRLSLADALAGRGQREGALAEYVWCLERAEKSGRTGRGGVLKQIHFLSSEHPPALTFLKEQRRTARARLLEDDVATQAVEDFALISGFLDEDADLLSVYDELAKKKSPHAATLFDEVTDLLIEKRRYRDVVSGGDALFKKVIALVDVLKGARPVPGLLDEASLKDAKTKMVQEVAALYEALLGADEAKRAGEMRDRLLALDASAAGYATLIRHARRAEKEDAVKALLERARAALSAEDFKRVEALR